MSYRYSWFIAIEIFHISQAVWHSWKRFHSTSIYSVSTLVNRGWSSSILLWGSGNHLNVSNAAQLRHGIKPTRRRMNVSWGNSDSSCTIRHDKILSVLTTAHTTPTLNSASQSPSPRNICRLHRPYISVTKHWYARFLATSNLFNKCFPKSSGSNLTLLVGTARLHLRIRDESRLDVRLLLRL